MRRTMILLSGSDPFSLLTRLSCTENRNPIFGKPALALFLEGLDFTRRRDGLWRLDIRLTEGMTRTVAGRRIYAAEDWWEIEPSLPLAA